MTQQSPQSARAPLRVAVLSREFPVRILNCSPAGCLVETNTCIDVGTVGSISLVVGGEECLDDVEVVRCQAIRGAGAVYHVAIRFLGTASARPARLWRALAQCGGPNPAPGTDQGTAV